MAERPPSDVADLLSAQGILDEDALKLVREQQKRQDVPVHRLILDLSLASERDTIQALCRLHSAEYREVEEESLSEDLLAQVPIKLVFHYRFLPLESDGETLTIACGDIPSSLELANLRLFLKQEIRYVLTPPSAIDSLIKTRFGLGAETVEQLRKSGGGPSEDPLDEMELALADPDDEGTIPALVDQLLAEALRLRATDIHFEPGAGRIGLRYRIDGILQPIPVPGGMHSLYSAIVTRLKVMASLDISERRLPQDGRISMKRKEETYDLRLSVVPTKHGEGICLRILGRQSLQLGYGQLGMLPFQERLFSQVPLLPQGFVLISGPTGSGKTTTLYTALNQANDGRRKILTIEDPVEYLLAGVLQIQTHESIGLTFSQGLRSILRHDPDVVLVGEIRDRETAEIAVRASQTGHLVFSTIHANDSISAIPRLIDMGVDASSLASTLNCSIAQRLARRICRACAAEDPSPEASWIEEMSEVLRLPHGGLRTLKGEGCLECQGTGSRGRIAIYEMAAVDEPFAEAIHDGASVGTLRQAAGANGWIPMRQAAFHRVQDGSITLGELKQLTWRLDFSRQGP